MMPEGKRGRQSAPLRLLASAALATTALAASTVPVGATLPVPIVETHVHDAAHQDITFGSSPVYSPIHDKVVVKGQSVTGKVDVWMWSNGDCTGTPHSKYLGLTLVNGMVETPAFTPRSTGMRSYLAWYLGDSANARAEGTCEPVTIVKRTPKVRTEVHDPYHADITGQTRTLGITVHDKAFVSGHGQYPPTGQVTFNRYTNGTCSGTPANVEANVPLVKGVAESTTFKPTKAGSYSYKVKYLGNNQYTRAWGPCEPFTIKEPTPPAAFLVIDEDSIDNGLPPMFFNAADVNDDIADEGQRRQLRYFAANVGKTITLWTGQVGDEGWFAPETIPSSWASAGPTGNGLRNFVGNPSKWPATNVGPGLGTGNDPERLLDKIPDVNPLRATGLRLLVGRTVCAVVYDSDISINYSPLNGSLKGANLGVVAFTVLSVDPLYGQSSGTLPSATIRIRDANVVCEGPIALFRDAPEPYSSSEPYDTGR